MHSMTETSHPRDDALRIILKYEEKKIVLHISPYGTVGDLKNLIQTNLNIPPAVQVIQGWLVSPSDDCTLLENCCKSDSNQEIYLSVSEPDEVNKDIKYEYTKFLELTDNYPNSYNTILDLDDLEECAALSFFQYFANVNSFDNNDVVFHLYHLEDIIDDLFMDSQKPMGLLLYLHNKTTQFSEKFCEHIISPKIMDCINQNFFFLGWDVHCEEYHSALIKALSYHADLSGYENVIKSKKSCAFLFVPDNGSLKLYSELTNDQEINEKTLFKSLKKAVEFLNPSLLVNNGAVKYQQVMLEMLGYRDYDSFDYYELEQLNHKIGYALFGCPSNEQGYSDEESKKIKKLYDIILMENNAVSKHKDQVVISIVYNCIEPLGTEKEQKAKCVKNYNPDMDFIPLPVFILQKCLNENNVKERCRIVIDHTGRVYNTWTDYLSTNTLHKCLMTMPKNGRYHENENGDVILEKHISPACGLGSSTLRFMDIAGSVAGITAGCVGVAAATIVSAPVAVVGAGLVGALVGVYSMGRSISTLVDRKAHKESIDLTHPEARNSWLNIGAGALGFLGAGANMVVSKLASTGSNIGKVSTVTLTTLNAANIGVSGGCILISGYDVYDQWWNDDQAPSALTVIQLTSSVLFFGHATLNFKTGATVVEESQKTSLKNFKDGLRSNRHRKMFVKMLKETITGHSGDTLAGQAEVIKTMTNLNLQKDQVFAALTRTNKLFNKGGIKFSADGGGISLNGVPLDVGQFTSMRKPEVITFLSQVPAKTSPVLKNVQVTNITSNLKNAFSNISAADFSNLTLKVVSLLATTDTTIQEKIINAVSLLATTFFSEADVSDLFDKMFNQEKYYRLFSIVTSFFQNIVDTMEEQFQKWMVTKDKQYEIPNFLTLPMDYASRASKIFNIVTNKYYDGTKLNKAGLEEILKYAYNWLANEALNYGIDSIRIKRREDHSLPSNSQKIKCKICSGVYFNPIKI